MKTASMLQDFSCYFLDVVDDMGRIQIPAAFLAGHIMEDLFCAQVKTGAEHLFAVLCAVTSMITWTIRTRTLKVCFSSSISDKCNRSLSTQSNKKLLKLILCLHIMTSNLLICRSFCSAIIFCCCCSRRELRAFTCLRVSSSTTAFSK